MSGQRTLPLLRLHFLTSVTNALSIVLGCEILSRTWASFRPAISSTSTAGCLPCNNLLTRYESRPLTSSRLVRILGEKPTVRGQARVKD